MWPLDTAAGDGIRVGLIVRPAGPAAWPQAWAASDFTRRAAPLVKLEIGFLQEAFPCMALENLCVPDVTPQRVHAIGHLEDYCGHSGAMFRPAGET